MSRSKHRQQLEEMYQEQVDPWEYRSHDEEIEKYAATLNSIPERRYRAALEVGSAEGVFTRSLASHADSVVGIEVSPTAVERAREYCAELDNVAFRVMDFIGDDLTEQFDLIVVSEVLYYVPFRARRSTARKIRSWLTEDGFLVLCHTRREHTRAWTDVYAESGAEGLHALFTTGAGMRVITSQRFSTFNVLVLAHPERKRGQLTSWLQALALDARTLPLYLVYGLRRFLVGEHPIGTVGRRIARRLGRED